MSWVRMDSFCHEEQAGGDGYSHNDDSDSSSDDIDLDTIEAPSAADEAAEQSASMERDARVIAEGLACGGALLCLHAGTL